MGALVAWENKSRLHDMTFFQCSRAHIHPVRVKSAHIFSNSHLNRKTYSVLIHRFMFAGRLWRRMDHSWSVFTAPQISIAIDFSSNSLWNVIEKTWVQVMNLRRNHQFYGSLDNKFAAFRSPTYIHDFLHPCRHLTQSFSTQCTPPDHVHNPKRKHHARIKQMSFPL